VPSRFVVFFLFYGGLMAGLALDRIRGWLRTVRLRRTFGAMRRVVPLVVVLLVTADVFAGTRWIVDRWKSPPLVGIETSGRFHLLSPNDYGAIYASLPQRERGTAGCYEAFPWPVARALWVGDVAQVRVEEGRGRVRDWGRTSNTAFAELELEEPARLVFNQTYAPGWTSTIGTPKGDRFGRLSVEVPATARRIEVRYQPEELLLAIALSLAGVLLALLVALGLRRERLERLWARLTRPFRRRA
jgi:hypothetical protein